MTLDAGDDVWQAIFALPAGAWEYKVALNETWDVNYGLHAVENGANIPLNLPQSAQVKFYYDDKTHWATDNQGSIIATVAGSFQSELGCPGDWDPGCLRSWLQDIDGDGIYTFETSALPAGTYEAKVAINESWDENYGEGGVPGGANIPFVVPATGTLMVFRYDSVTHVLTIDHGSIIATVAGSFQSELGCPGDWDPSCLLSRLQDSDGDGIYTFETSALPAGTYEAKVAINESWDENYGEGGVPGGANIPFVVPATGTLMVFLYDSVTHVLTIESPVPTEHETWGALKSGYR